MANLVPTPHNNAKLGEIAETVLLPGDPLRAKYIAETFLDNYVLVNTVRNIYAYTGKYKGKPITIMASGIGMPSMGIYSYELYTLYNVENIIRIGSCVSYSSCLSFFDIVLANNIFSESNFALSLNNDNCHLVKPSYELNDIIQHTALINNIELVIGNTLCLDCFDLYMTDINQFFKRIPKDFNPISGEMESFALHYIAQMLNKKASTLMSVVDSKYIDTIISTEEREKGLNLMITLALESSLNI